VSEEDLSRSSYRTTERGREKSCPRCSEQFGAKVFHPIEDFGVRVSNGVEIFQSWCSRCRSIKAVKP
jgi:hypothetical protein